MAPFRAVAAFVFLALLVPEGLALLSSSPKKKKAHHRHHHRHHKAHNKSSSTASPVAAAAQAQKLNQTEVAAAAQAQKLNQTEMAAAAQAQTTNATADAARLVRLHNKLVKAWKHKVHMAKLRQTMEAEKQLLKSQQALLSSGVDDVSDSAARQQAAATQAMMKDATIMLHDSRQDAITKTHSVLEEAYQIEKQKKADIEKSSDVIAKAEKAKQEAEKQIENIAAVINAATEEETYFSSQDVSVGQEQMATEDSNVGASNKSSSTPSETAKKSVSIAEKQHPEHAKLKQQVHQKDDSPAEGTGEGPAKEAKKKDTSAKSEQPPEPQLKQGLKIGKEVQTKDDSTEEQE